MDFVRLSGKTGEVVESGGAEGDSAGQLVRHAILVHAGPNKSTLVFKSGDGPIKFDDARIKRVVAVHNKYVDDLAKQYGGVEKIPVGAYPPILDMHDDEGSMNCVIGRLTGYLSYEVRDVPKVGKNVPCAVADKPGITWLGEGTVQRVKDGRIFHLSIGISEKTDRLGETSAVIEPAAPGAMSLSKEKPGSHTKNNGGPKMGDKIKRLKAHTARLTKLTAISETLVTLSKKTKETSDQVKLTARQGEVTHRLTGLMRSGKLTPAEHKKMDIKRLSTMSDGDMKTIMEVFEAREPVIEPGQRGSTNATDFSDIGANLEKKQLKRLKSEIKGDFKRLTGKEMKTAEDDEDADHGKTHEMGGGNKEAPVNPGKDPHAVDGQGGDEKSAEFAKHMSALSKHLAAGNLDEAKKAHEAVMAHCSKHGLKHMEAGDVGDVKSDDYKKSMEAHQGQIDELNTQMARMAGMVSELMDVEKEEGHDLEKEDEADGAGDGGAAA